MTEILGEVGKVSTETGETPSRVKGFQLTCGASFDYYLDASNPSTVRAEGLLDCSIVDCVFNRTRIVTGDAEVGVTEDPSDHALDKVRRRAGMQMAGECLVWRQNPQNTGQGIPDSMLPQNLRRS